MCCIIATKKVLTLVFISISIELHYCNNYNYMTNPDKYTGSKVSTLKDMVEYTDALGKSVCTLVACGNDDKDVEVELGLKPRNIYYWLWTVPTFRKDYELALENRAYSLAQEAKQIADEEVYTNTDAKRQQTRVNSRQWHVERLLKRLYALRSEVTGNDGGSVKLEIVRSTK